jgi:hypothetical protein
MLFFCEAIISICNSSMFQLLKEKSIEMTLSPDNEISMPLLFHSDNSNEFELYNLLAQSETQTSA